MTQKTNRLLMLLIGAAIAGCSSQTQRTSSGPGEQTQYERVGGSSNAVTQEELQRRAAAEAAQSAAAPEPAPAPAQPRPVVEVAPAAEPARASSTPVKDEALPDFPITNEGPGQAASEEAATAAAAKDEDVEDLGPQADESVSEPQEAVAAADSSVGETTMYDDGDNDGDKSAEVEDLGPQADESVSESQEALAAAGSSVGDTTTYADEDDKDQSAEVEDLGMQPDESVSAAQAPATPPEKTVGEPTVYPDEPVVAQAKPDPKPAPTKTISINFETEPLFNFDRFQVRGDQRSKLDDFISSLSGTQYDSIAVVGHTDRIGKDAYNQNLSERRAQAVKEYLVSKGIPAAKIQDAGRGKAEPTSGDACDKIRGRKKLIACLQPDRRVEVSVSATKK